MATSVFSSRDNVLLLSLISDGKFFFLRLFDDAILVWDEHPRFHFHATVIFRWLFADQKYINLASPENTVLAKTFLQVLVFSYTP